MKRIVFITLLLVSASAFGFFQLTKSSTKQSSSGHPKLVFYTSSGATSAQAPFWAAVKAGWPNNRELETHYWKDLDDLRSTMLAAKGDVWIGHTDGFAQAALRGAPVTLVAVTAWKKFYFLSTDPEVNSLDDLAQVLEKKGEPLVVAPPDSPAYAILNGLTKAGGPKFRVERKIPRQLMLEAMNGSVRHMLVPEPLVTTLLMKRPELKTIACLEEEYSKRAGGTGTLPIAGVAVRTGLLKEDPALVKSLVQAMVDWTSRLTPDSSGNEVIAVLPKNTLDELGLETVKHSMQRDPVSAVPAWKARNEITAYFSLVYPEAVKNGRLNLPAPFIMEPQ